MNGELNVLFFASLADQLKCRSLALPFPHPAVSAGQLRDALIEQHGETWNALRSDQLRCAVNQQIVKMDHPLKPGDEIAFFPPVTGG
jgi:molybdopterin converting factor subunit 1